jgi:Transposase and inactivated derivatives
MKTSILKQNVGIDISMDDFKVSVQSLTSSLSIEVKGAKTFTNDLAGYTSFLDWVLTKTCGNCPVCFTMEATGVYYEGLAYYLHGQGYTAHVVLPNQAKRYGQSLGARSKTDVIDARILGQMGLERSLKKWEPASAHFLTLKSLTREREALVCERTAAINRLHAYSHQGCHQDRCIQRAKLQIAFYDTQIAEIEKDIRKVVDSDKALCERLSYVESIKGVGFLTAVIVVAETNGFASFENIRQVTSYAGMDIKIKESGKYKGKSKISKCGNRFIRKALYMPAFSMITHDDPTAEFYHRLSERKGVKMVAAVAVQRKLLGLIYTLWKKQEMFKSAG